MVPVGWTLSSSAKAHETAFSGLNKRSLEPGPRNIELPDDLPIDAHAPLSDQPSRLARRRYTGVLDEKPW